VEEADRQDRAVGQGHRLGQRLRQRAAGAEGVSVVFGEAFGLSPFFRISYATANACWKTPAAASSASAET
jgi:aspartate/methionine/tyrosine aminotransferase